MINWIHCGHSQWLMAETGDCQWLDSEWQWVTAILRKQKWAKSFPCHVANDAATPAACFFAWVTGHHFPPWLCDSEIQWWFACCILLPMVHWYPMAHTDTHMIHTCHILPYASCDSYAICNHMHMFANVDSIKSICSRCQWPSRFKDSEPFHSIPQARKILGLRHVSAAQEIQ